MPDRSNGYEQLAADFIASRNQLIGVAKVADWCKTLPRGAFVLDLGCGPGVPITRVLVEHGFSVYAVDASSAMIAALRGRFPHVQAECQAAEDSEFFHRSFDGILAWGLIFLLEPETQAAVIRKAARALNPKGSFLFTAPAESCTWRDVMTGRPSVSLGLSEYMEMLASEGLTAQSWGSDEGDNHYYLGTRGA